MPVRRKRADAQTVAASAPSESSDTIWSELSEAQRAAILATIAGSDGAGRTVDVADAVHETMAALRRGVGRETGPNHRGRGRPGAGGFDPSTSSWGWHPHHNGLLGATCDPGAIVGGNAPLAGTLVCQRVSVPAGSTVHEILLDVAMAGADLVLASAAIYEADGARTGLTADQRHGWTRTGLHRMPLAAPIAAQRDPRQVWIGFVAAGEVVPGFAVPWISGIAQPNLGLADPGPQRAGEIADQTGCPAAITPARMRSGPQYWAALA